MCFPFVDDETRGTLELLMDEAVDYLNFTERLVDYVCRKEVTPVLGYFAFFHSYNLARPDLIDRLVTVKSVSDLVKPIVLLVDGHREVAVEWDDMRLAVVKALEAMPNDWLASHLYLTWRLGAERFYSESDVDIQPVKILENRITGDEDLEYFVLHLYLLKAQAGRRAGDIENSKNWLNLAITLARRQDDQMHIVELLIALANRVKNDDLDEALDYLKESKDICESLGYHRGLTTVLHELGHISTIRGKLDEAIKTHQDKNRISGMVGDSGGPGDIVLALNYNLRGDGEAALKLARAAIQTMEHRKRRIASPYLYQVWALLNMDRIAEASEEFETAMEFSVKSGLETYLVIANLLEGLIEKKEGRFQSALLTLEDALSKSRSYGYLVWIGQCLLHLADIEVELFDPKKEIVATCQGLG
jgi:tetratricopeptide (TPR) repeat protein